MINIQREIFSAGIFSAVYLAVFYIGEVIHRKYPEKSEVSRKFVHLTGGCVALSFPYFLRSHWTVLALALSFAAIILFSKQKGILRSVHGVQRKSHGGVYFPVAIYSVFLFSHEFPIFYFIPIFVMTVSDTLAALMGGRYGSVHYDVEGNTKSVEGSAVFFFITFLAIHLPLLLMTQTGRLESVIIALVIALLVTGFEMISLSGSDNIFVPFGTYFILVKMIKHPLSTDIQLLIILIFLVATAFLLNWRFKFLKSSGLVGMILVNYAAWALCSFSWFLVLFLAELMYYFLLMNFHKNNQDQEIIQYQIRAITYMTLTPVILIFIANARTSREVMYLPFIASVTSQMAVIATFFIKDMFKQNSSLNALFKKNVLLGSFCVLLTVALVAALPLLRSHTLPLPWGFIIVFLATGAAYLIHPFIDRHYPRGAELRGFRVVMLSSLFAIAIAFLGQALL